MEETCATFFLTCRARYHLCWVASKGTLGCHKRSRHSYVCPFPSSPPLGWHTQLNGTDARLLRPERKNQGHKNSCSLSRLVSLDNFSLFSALGLRDAVMPFKMKGGVHNLRLRRVVHLWCNVLNLWFGWVPNFRPPPWGQEKCSTPVGRRLGSFR